MNTSRDAAGVPLKPPLGGVAVRMYRQGLGDCFLLAFATSKQRPTFVLIDCGVHSAQKNGQDNLRLVLDDIVAVTGGRLDALVVTHEHTDHLSAFVKLADRIAPYKRAGGNTAAGDDPPKLRIKRLWLGWAEDPDDSLAQSLDRSRRLAQRALAAAVHKIDERVDGRQLAMAEAEPLRATVQSALSFFAINADDPGLAAAGSERNVASADALNMLRERAGSVRYFRPGEPPLRIPGTAAARAYVLGPPLDVRLLKKSKPSAGERQETYLTEGTGLISFGAAALGSDSADADGNGEVDLAAADHNELCNPFAGAYRVPYEAARKLAFFRRWYGIGESYHEHSWRQIDSDWLYAAEQLALDLDSHTNNTSLALAFELGPRGRGPVLLFAADAQVGSWLSWSNLSWGSRPKITTRDLFGRTVLYKVGHHASHNATLKHDAEGGDYGLELMPEGLVAFIPVDRAAASKLRGWDMPAHNLYEALRRKTRGHILRADEADDAAVPPEELRAIPGRSGMKWRRAAAMKAGGDGPLYYDLFLKPSE